MAGSHTKACATCSKPASLACSRCKGAPDGAQGVVTVWYCTKECQKRDWEDHKPTCKASKDREKLYRAAYVAQQVVHIFYVSAFAWPIDRIEKQGTEWHIYSKFIKGGKIVDSAAEAFPNMEERLAVVTYQGCCGALAFLHELLKMLLNDLCSKIEEVTLWIKNQKLRITHDEPGHNIFGLMGNTHSILRVTTMAGEIYALDMTGAQYGWTEPILPWDVFANTRLRTIDHVDSFGWHRPYYKNRCHSSVVGYKGYHDVMEDFGRALDDYIGKWQKKNVSLQALLNLPQDQFQAKREALMAYMESSLGMYRKVAFNLEIDQFKGTEPEIDLMSTVLNLQKFKM